MLYLVGIGLNDEKDISQAAIEVIESSDSVFCEFFTSSWSGSIKKLEKTTGKKIKILERKDVESDFLIREAKKKKVALLVAGDPLSATTHIHLMLDARKNNIDTQVIHSSSILTAVAETGLQLYKFGRTTTLPFPQDKYSPESQFDVIKENKKHGLHTLVLLDIHPDRQMTAKQGIEIMINHLPDQDVIACCCLGSKKQTIVYGKMSELKNMKKLDRAPAVIIVRGKLHFMEEECLELWKKQKKS